MLASISFSCMSLSYLARVKGWRLWFVIFLHQQLWTFEFFGCLVTALCIIASNIFNESGYRFSQDSSLSGTSVDVDVEQWRWIAILEPLMLRKLDRSSCWLSVRYVLFAFVWIAGFTLSMSDWWVLVACVNIKVYLLRMFLYLFSNNGWGHSKINF